MAYEENIVCDQCGAKARGRRPIVPFGWVTLSGAGMPLSGIFCDPDCVVKFIEEFQVQESR